jgi:hypothetical protein
VVYKILSFKTWAKICHQAPIQLAKRGKQIHVYIERQLASRRQKNYAQSPHVVLEINTTLLRNKVWTLCYKPFKNDAFWYCNGYTVPRKALRKIDLYNV